MSLTPPGWYPDPHFPGDLDRQRYWDGEQWTNKRAERRRPWTGSSGSLAPPTGGARRFVFPVLACLGLVLVALAVVALAERDDETPGTSAATTGSTIGATTPGPATTIGAPPPPPVRTDGTGAALIPITRPDGDGQPTIVYATHRGDASFVLKAGDELLVNEVGGYEGYVLLTDAAAAQVEVQADGPWRIEFRSVRLGKLWGGAPEAGSGDQVLFYGGTGGVAAFTHTGDGEFVVERYPLDQSFPLSLVNAIGAFNGRVPFEGHASVVAITADGDWTAAVTAT